MTIELRDFGAGLQQNREPFNIDNKSFPVMQNFFVFRGRPRKKRGTSLLGRLQRDLTNQALGNTDGAGNFVGNIITILGLNSLASIVPGSITVTVGAQTFNEPGTPDGSLSNGGAGTGTIDYSTGAIALNTDPNLAATAVTIDFSYYPNLPVMGLEDFLRLKLNVPDLVAFDTTYAYQFNQGANVFYDVSKYKYTSAPVVWSAPDNQQFWSTSFAGAMWVTNNKPGFHFRSITAAPVVGANTQFTINGHGLQNGDIVFINEVVGITGVNGVSGVVTVVDPNNFTIPTPGAAGAWVSGGIAQYLTRSTSNNLDGIRWYDGDPNTATPAPRGFVNFAPPLQNTTTPSYLVGAKIIVAFKDRLLMMGIWEATSAAPAGIFYPNRICWCWNGTPYYAEARPTNETYDARAWHQNVVGFGGRLGITGDVEIVDCEDNEDVLLVGTDEKQVKVLYTADDTLPFLAQSINSELGSQHTFGSISLDTGKVSSGEYGFALTTQTSSQRIDLQIPDQIFNIRSNASNTEDGRLCAVRDWRNEFIYFTYPYAEHDATKTPYPSRTLLWNYRDNTWAELDENYTTYGYFRRTAGYTWATLPFPTWSAWTIPWNFGQTSPRYPFVIGGNQQGFVMIKTDGTSEAASKYISDINVRTITSPRHCLQVGDYIQFSSILGGVDAATLNGLVAVVESVPDVNTFTVTFCIDDDLTQPSGGTDYIGGGMYTKFIRPFMQSKQFPVFWDRPRKTRIGTQRYLFQSTDKGEVTALVYVSQDPSNPTNTGFAYLPSTATVLTRAEPGRPASALQDQIWHRCSNSFVGDSVQIGITLSDEQMCDPEISNNAEIELHAVVINVYPGPILS